MSSAARDARPESFSQAAPAALANAQVRANIRHATGSIRTKRAALVAEVPDWEALREAAAAIKDAALSRLDEVLVELEASVETAGGVARRRGERDRHRTRPGGGRGRGRQGEVACD